jgi:hypothetical protein
MAQGSSDAASVKVEQASSSFTCFSKADRRWRQQSIDRCGQGRAGWPKVAISVFTDATGDADQMPTKQRAGRALMR